MPVAGARKPANAKEGFSLSKGQKQCGGAFLVIALIIGASHVFSPPEDEVAAPAATATGTAVTPLNDETFDKFVQSHPEGVLVDFFMPNCKFCTKLAPEFEMAAKKLKSENIPFASVDKDASEKLMNKFNIDRFPTVLWFWRGQNVGELPRSGEKKADEIIEWAKWAMSPAIQDEMDLKTFDENLPLLRSSLHETSRLMVAYNRKGSEGMRESFEIAARLNRPKTIYLFIAVGAEDQPHLLKALAKDPALDEEYTGAVNAQEVATWVQETLAKAAPPKTEEPPSSKAADDAMASLKNTEAASE